MQNAVDTSDIVILSGGVSVGDFDFVADAINHLSLKVHFTKVAVKPGKPVTFATSGQKSVIGLPGNPVSVYLMFHLFVLRTARLMSGLSLDDKYLQMPIAHDYKRKRAQRFAFIPCKLNNNGTVEQLNYHGSAHLQALLDSDGFFAVPKNIESLSAGDNVEFLLFKGSL